MFGVVLAMWLFVVFILAVSRRDGALTTGTLAAPFLSI